MATPKAASAEYVNTRTFEQEDPNDASRPPPPAGFKWDEFGRLVPDYADIQPLVVAPEDSIPDIAPEEDKKKDKPKEKKSPVGPEFGQRADGGNDMGVGGFGNDVGGYGHGFGSSSV